MVQDFGKKYALMVCEFLGERKTCQTRQHRPSDETRRREQFRGKCEPKTRNFLFARHSTTARIATLARIQKAGPSDARAAGGSPLTRSVAKEPAPARLPQSNSPDAGIVRKDRSFVSLDKAQKRQARQTDDRGAGLKSGGLGQGIGNALGEPIRRIGQKARQEMPRQSRKWRSARSTRSCTFGIRHWFRDPLKAPASTLIERALARGKIASRRRPDSRLRRRLFRSNRARFARSSFANTGFKNVP